MTRSFGAPTVQQAVNRFIVDAAARWSIVMFITAAPVDLMLRAAHCSRILSVAATLQQVRLRLWDSNPKQNEAAESV